MNYQDILMPQVNRMFQRWGWNMQFSFFEDSEEIGPEKDY